MLTQASIPPAVGKSSTGPVILDRVKAGCVMYVSGGTVAGNTV